MKIDLQKEDHSFNLCDEHNVGWKTMNIRYLENILICIFSNLRFSNSAGRLDYSKD